MYTNTYNGNYGYKGIKSHGSSSAFAPSGIDHATTAGQLDNSMIQTKTYQVPVSGVVDSEGKFNMDMAPYIPLPPDFQILTSYFVSTDILTGGFTGIDVGKFDVIAYNTTLLSTDSVKLQKGVFGKNVTHSIDLPTIGIRVNSSSTIGTKISFNMTVTLVYVCPPGITV